MKLDWRWSVPVLLAGLVPFALLTSHAVPQADDFVYGAITRSEGLLGGVRQIYQDWSGRFFSNFLIMLPTAIADTTGADRVLVGQMAGFVVFGLLAALAFGTVRLLVPSAPLWCIGPASLLFLYVLLSNARSVRDTLLWVPGIATYAVAGILGAGLYVWLHSLAARSRPIPPEALIWLCPLMAVTAGANEFTGPALVIIVAASFGLRAGLAGRPRQPWTHAALALSALIGLAIVLAAPGNETRVAHQSAGGDPLETLIWGPIYFLNYLALRVDSPGLVGWLLVVALIVRRHDRRQESQPAGAPLLVWVPLAVFAAYGLLAFSAGVFGFGSLLPGRAQNQVHLTGMVLASVAVAEAVRVHGPALSDWRKRRLPGLTDPGAAAE